MTPQTTLDAVRELSENAMLRPVPKRVRLVPREERSAGVRRAIIPYEELYPVRIGGKPGRAFGYKPRKAPAQHVTRTAMEKDFMSIAAEKAEAATERRPIVLPSAH